MVEQKGPASACERSRTLTSSSGSFMRGSGIDPGTLGAVGLLEGGDLRVELQRQAELVQALQQHVLAPLRDVEADSPVDLLVREVDFEGLACLGFAHQLLHIGEDD